MRLYNHQTLTSLKTRHQGFTLVELVIVIVLLGILAVVALPRFINLSDDAHIAVVAGTAGALKVGVKSIESLSQVNSISSGQRDLPGSFNDAVDVNSSGFPIGQNVSNNQLNTDSIGVQGENNDHGCRDIWNALLNNGPSVSRTDDGSDYEYERHTTGRVCSFIYRKNGDDNGRTTARLGILYDSRDGTVQLCGTDNAATPSC
jgi:prepilin-type N-terminal cleavage/methylation domain-containing protein